jgi:hypothetical protein
MAKNQRNPFESELVSYLIKTYFDKDVAKFAAHTGYTKQQINYWHTGQRKPQSATLRWLISTTIAPEFQVVCEFKPVSIHLKKNISAELTKALGGHGEKCGVYAFYDSMCNVVYVGKASTNLQTEMYQQLRAQLDIHFPKAVKSAPIERWQVAKYVSAYEIPEVEHLDYPKHVEALVLRLSKPVGNKVLGNLTHVKRPIEK